MTPHTTLYPVTSTIMVMSTVPPVWQYHRIRLTIIVDGDTIFPVWRYGDDALVSRRGGMLRDSIDCNTQRVLSISSVQEDRPHHSGHRTVCDDASARYISDDDRDRLGSLADTPYRSDDDGIEHARSVWYHDE